MEGASQRFQGWAGRAPGGGPEPQGRVFGWTRNRGEVSVAGREQGSKKTQLGPRPAACAPQCQQGSHQLDLGTWGDMRGSMDPGCRPWHSDSLP